jgi:hypothetical protein
MECRRARAVLRVAGQQADGGEPKTGSGFCRARHSARALPPAHSGHWAAPYDAAPDGQRFLVRATPGQAGEPLTVIVNWPALLKKGAAVQ